MSVSINGFKNSVGLRANIAEAFRDVPRFIKYSTEELVRDIHPVALSKRGHPSVQLVASMANQISSEFLTVLDRPLDLDYYGLTREQMTSLGISNTYYSPYEHRLFFTEQGYCTGICLWFAWLYFETQSKFTSSFIQMQWIGSQFARGAKLPAVVLQILRCPEKHLRLKPENVHINFYFHRRFTKTMENKIRKLPVGVYSFFNKDHSFLFIREENNSGYYLDPNIGLLQLQGDTLPIDLYLHVRKTILFISSPHELNREEMIEALVQKVHSMLKIMEAAKDGFLLGSTKKSIIEVYEKVELISQEYMKENEDDLNFKSFARYVSSSCKKFYEDSVERFTNRECLDDVQHFQLSLFKCSNYTVNIVKISTK